MVKLMREAVMVDYIAKIKPINADKIETQVHGIATSVKMVIAFIFMWKCLICL